MCRSTLGGADVVALSARTSSVMVLVLLLKLIKIILLVLYTIVHLEWMHCK